LRTPADLAAVLKNLWLLLTEVPGWPDAPAWARFRRTLPILLPCAGLALLEVWHFGFHAPRVRAELTELQPLFALEQEVSALSLACSERQVAELAENVASASRLLVATPEDISVALRSLKKESADRGFDSNFVSSENALEATTDDAPIAFISVRGKLAHKPIAADPFQALLALLDRLAASGKRIDLTRMAIRADEQKWRTVELNLRLVRPASHEKTP
jgi:hypothetical protein